MPRRRVPSKGLYNSEGRRGRAPGRGSPLLLWPTPRRAVRPAVGLGRVVFFCQTSKGGFGRREARAGARRCCCWPTLSGVRSGRRWVSVGFFFCQTSQGGSVGGRPAPGLAAAAVGPRSRACGPAGGESRFGLFFWPSFSRLVSRSSLNVSQANAGLCQEPKLKGARPDGERRAPPHGYPDPPGSSGARRGVQCPRPGHGAGDPGRPGVWISGNLKTLSLTPRLLRNKKRVYNS